MAKKKQQIIADIAEYFLGTAYSDCYVGITSDVHARLFGDHQVSQTSDRWIHRTASSHFVAREVEEYFLSAGMDGGSGGGDRRSRLVYAYKRTSQTLP
ncbi:MAG: hypothetical protein HKO65_07920 [Gemmatimonadetes bacterium]|nr:hypothetical protein [Gemmatimonadota bacterium]NNM05017.1 hypothetical protein [Gemmatimonadota bacterium]